MTKEEYERQLQAFEEAEAAMKADLEKIAKLEEALKALKENENPKDEERDEYVKILKEAQSLGCLDIKTIDYLGRVIAQLKMVDIDAGKTWCNLYMIGEIDWRYDTIIPLNDMNTLSGIFDEWDKNGQVEKIERTADGELNHQEASQRADNGEIIVAIFKNPSGKSGHGVFVVGGSGDRKITIDGLDNDNGSNVENKNSQNYKDRSPTGLRNESFSLQFGKDKDVNTEFYVIDQLISK
jgi:hypothetical protein